MLARTPERYLAGGWLDAGGAVRAGLRGADATGAAMHLMAAGVAPQELGFTVAALTLVLPQHEESGVGEKLAAALTEALATVARAIQQPNNQGLTGWLGACAARVATEADLEAFMGHVTAVDRQYTMIVAMQPV